MGERVAMLVRNSYTHDTRVEKEVRTLVAAGHEVTVVADAGTGLAERDSRDGASIVRVPRSASRVPGLRFVLHEVGLVRVLSRLRPTVLHAHDSNAILPVALAARWLRAPWVLDAHELWLGRPPRDRSWPYRFAYHAWYTVVERLFVPRAAAHITVSQPIARHYERVYRLPRVALVPNYPELSRPVQRRELRDLAPKLPGDAPIILHIGAYLPDRGLEQLVEALRGVPGSHLVVLGAGPRGPELEALAASIGLAGRVHALESVSSDQVIDYAASATIGVAPIIPTTLNNRYSMPNKLFQYLAAGIPVLASELPQMREIIEASGAGATADTTRPQAIADRLNELLRTDLELMGRAARRAVEERYSWEQSASVLRSIYERIGTQRA